MKTPVASNWIAGLVLAMTWLPGSLAQNETPRPLSSASDATPAVTPARPEAETPPALSGTLELPSPPVIPLTNGVIPKSSSPKVRLSPWANEIVKLAEARLDDDVLYSFIDNSGTFNLGAEQIIYLSDLGVSSAVITAMLQHDQDLVSGVRPLTIASEPAHEPILPEPIAVTSVAPAKASPPAAAPNVPSAPLSVEPAATPVNAITPEVNAPAANVQIAALPQTATAGYAAVGTPALSSPRPAAASAKKSLYPTREGRAVELTAPIIFLGEQERTPNTFIIVGFPKTEPAAP